MFNRLFIFLFLLFGCSANSQSIGEEYWLHIDTRFTNDQVEDILEATNYWEMKTGVIIHTNMENADCNDEHYDFQMCIHPSTLDYVIDRMNNPEAVAVTIFFPFSSDDNIYIAMDARPWNQEHFDKNAEFAHSMFRGTLMHEIGHAMGLAHSSNPTDLMAVKGHPNYVITCNDVSAFSDLRRNMPRFSNIPCKEGELNWREGTWSK